MGIEVERQAVRTHRGVGPGGLAEAADVGRGARQRLAGDFGDHEGVADRGADRPVRGRHHVARREADAAGDQLDRHFRPERQRLRRGDGHRIRRRPRISTSPAISSKRSTPSCGAALLRQHPAGADIGMAGERHLAAAIEDAHPRGVRRIGRRQHEGRLAEIELGGERLHVGVAHAARVGKDGERIAAEAAVGEDVDGDEGEGRHPRLLDDLHADLARNSPQGSH